MRTKSAIDDLHGRCHTSRITALVSARLSPCTKADKARAKLLKSGVSEALGRSLAHLMLTSNTLEQSSIDVWKSEVKSPKAFCSCKCYSIYLSHNPSHLFPPMLVSNLPTAHATVKRPTTPANMVSGFLNAARNG